MTTIAWDGETLACDSQGTQGNRKRFGVKKIYAPEEEVTIYGKRVLLIGYSGTSGDDRHVIQYLNEWKDKPNQEMHPEVDCTVILITEENKCITFQKNEDKKLPWIYENKPPYAIGTGGDFAVSAMSMGMTAGEAVEFAIELDVYSGGEVICYPFKR